MNVAIESKVFKVASVSDNSNSFGLRGHVLVAEDGEAWECGITGQFSKKKGDLVTLRYDDAGALDWAWFGAELPKSLGTAPRNVVNEIW